MACLHEMSLLPPSLSFGLPLTYAPSIPLAASPHLASTGNPRTLAFLPSAAHAQFVEAKPIHVFALNKQKDVTKDEYFIQLSTCIYVVRYLLHQGLAFRGPDESPESDNEGIF